MVENLRMSVALQTNVALGALAKEVIHREGYASQILTVQTVLIVGDLRLDFRYVYS